MPWWRIVAAGKKFGVEVESKDGLPAEVKSASPLKRRGVAGQRGRLDVTIDHPQHGRFEIRHMGDEVADLRLPPIDISRTAD